MSVDRLSSVPPVPPDPHELLALAAEPRSREDTLRIYQDVLGLTFVSDSDISKALDTLKLGKRDVFFGAVNLRTNTQDHLRRTFSNTLAFAMQTLAAAQHRGILTKAETISRVAILDAHRRPAPHDRFAAGFAAIGLHVSLRPGTPLIMDAASGIVDTEPQLECALGQPPVLAFEVAHRGRRPNTSTAIRLGKALAWFRADPHCDMLVGEEDIRNHVQSLDLGRLAVSDTPRTVQRLLSNLAQARVDLPSCGIDKTVQRTVLACLYRCLGRYELYGDPMQRRQLVEAFIAVDSKHARKNVEGALVAVHERAPKISGAHAQSFPHVRNDIRNFLDKVAGRVAAGLNV